MNNAVLFQGQGSYRTGYVRALLEKRPELRDLWKEADEILGWSISGLLADTENAGKLNTQQAQPLIFLMEYTAWHTFGKTLSQLPCFLTGHSLGELTALTAAEALTFEDSLRLVAKRGELMQQMAEGGAQGMLTLRNIEKKEAEGLCSRIARETGQVLICANYNSVSQIAVSGQKVALERLAAVVGEKAKPMLVTRAFHSPLMQSVASELDRFMEGITFHPLRIPVISNVTAQPYPASWAVQCLLKQQIASPVRWSQTMNFLLEHGITCFLQVTDSTLFRSMDRTLSEALQWGSLEEMQNGKLYDFDRLYRQGRLVLQKGAPLGDCLRKMIADPWPEASQAKQTIAAERYARVQAILQALPNEGEPEKAHTEEALRAMCDVLVEKGMPSETRQQAVCQILRKYGIEEIVPYGEFV